MHLSCPFPHVGMSVLTRHAMFACTSRPGDPKILNALAARARLRYVVLPTIYDTTPFRVSEN
ncbi:uncharacterized protein J3R85_003223 [Psidium guajava]|nr:uncharacterized protein J3R85_003223 [Psidium guajava]